jgi:hypothetical protein
MSDNELKLCVVALVIFLIMWSFRFLRKNKMLESGRIYEKAEFAWRIYREANSPDQRLFAACIGFCVMTFSIPKSIFYLLVVLATVTIGGVFNNTVWQFLFDVVQNIVKPLVSVLKPLAPGPGARNVSQVVGCY